MQLVVMNIDNENTTSGVTRYVQMLLGGLKSYSSIQVVYICLMSSNTLIFPRITRQDGYLEILFPLPLDKNNIIAERYWNNGYNAFVFKYFENILQAGCILHLQYVNLIDLALYIKKRIPCKIIAHLHCIPWKSLYDRDVKKFNMLYHAVYKKKGDMPQAHEFSQIVCEMDYYHKSDYVVCVTKCAAGFLVNYMNVPSKKIRVIYNGLTDCVKKVKRESKVGIKRRVLYVGVLSKSKGLTYILDALRIVRRKGFDVELVVAGTYTSQTKDKIYHDYPDIPIILKGLICYKDLQDLYRTCEIGIIASMQEQCSYAAIEMLMHGMPVVSTMIDGLGEIFKDEESALKIDTVFSPIMGLSVNVEQMANQILRLFSNLLLRQKLQNGGRLRYENKFTLRKMMDSTVKLYNEILKNEDNFGECGNASV